MCKEIAMTDYDEELEKVLHHAEEVEQEAADMLEHVRQAEDRLHEAQNRTVQRVLGDQHRIPEKRRPK